MLVVNIAYSQVSPNEQVNVFLGSAGDHGQMSPSASYPFSMISVGPITNPGNHTGYDYYAKQFGGFVHTHLEGVGCTGSGGNILIKPIVEGNRDTKLIRKFQEAQPGYYHVAFENEIDAKMTVAHNSGLHKYSFEGKNNGLYVDISYAFCGRYINEEHTIEGTTISGWVDTGTTCSRGVYRIYYCMDIPTALRFEKVGEHQYIANCGNERDVELRIGFSSVSVEYSKARVPSKTFKQMQEEVAVEWKKMLSTIKVKGDEDREKLFYSLLYRGLQAPYVVSEPDGVYRAIDGSDQKNDFTVYNGWAIWDNYREQLPMLSIFYSDIYGDVAKSIANLYHYGKNDWATHHEPTPTVRTEHAIVVLLDAWAKGYDIDFASIKDKLIEEADKLGYNSPDQSLESSYDCWAMSRIMKICNDQILAEEYREKALEYKKYWEKDFKDISKNDVDIMGARGMYQGTIWQYRWFVPFDIAGLKELIGGDIEYIRQLDEFFGGFYYNHANQPDLQVPGMYNSSGEPWKSQEMYYNILVDTMVQCYFNNNSKGIDPYIGRIYQNQPRAYITTMDDDVGTMSSWFVLRSLGLSAANVGDAVYYLTTPIFEEVEISYGKASFKIKVTSYNKSNKYIKAAKLNGKTLNRNWLTQEEITSGGELIIETSDKPNKKWGTKDQWVSCNNLNSYYQSITMLFDDEFRKI